MEFSFHIYVKHYQVIEAYKVKKKDSVIYASNHGNAFYDAFSIVFSDSKIAVFLTRAGVFGSRLANFWLGVFYMMPIYRQRDGIKAVAKNQEILSTCIDLLNEGRHAIAMFPEGNHNMRLGLRPLQKGIARMAFEALEKYPEMNLKIIPIGINYSAPMNFRANVLVLKGEPIYIQAYFELYQENKALAIKKLLDDLSVAMQQLTLEIPSEGYEEIYSNYIKYRKHGKDLKMNFENDKALIKDLVDGKIPEGFVPNNSGQALLLFRRLITLPIGVIAWISNIIPIILIRLLVKKVVSDPHFIDSIKYAGATFLFPILYFIQALVIYLILENAWLAACYFILIPFISKFYFEYLYKK
jgi:1-acyl-sn-glycerol-3-phosphate acyltransferase